MSYNNPRKKADRELYKLISKSIEDGNYWHAQQRLQERNINDLDVLKILEGEKTAGRERNENKDKYEDHYDE